MRGNALRSTELKIWLSDFPGVVVDKLRFQSVRVEIRE